MKNKEFVPHFMQDMQMITPPIEDKIPWLNDDTINPTISIQWWSAVTASTIAYSNPNMAATNIKAALDELRALHP